MVKKSFHDYELDTYEADVFRMELSCRLRDKKLLQEYIHGEEENYESIFYKEEIFDEESWDWLS